MNRIYLIAILLLSHITLKAQDVIPPSIACPPNDTVTLPPGGDCTFQYFYAIASSDNEPGDTLVQLAGLESGEGFPIGNTVNVFQAIDAAGNTASCSFTLTVQNYAGPLTCKNDISISLDATCAWIPGAADLLSGNAGCTNGYYLLEADKTPPYGNDPWVAAEFGPDDIGKTFSFRVSDTTFGYQCIGSVSINDLLPPALTCDSFDISCAVDNVSPYFLRDSLGIAVAVPTAMDACGPLLSFQHQDITVPDSCTSNYVGYLNRKWTAQDNFGNTSTCIQRIGLVRPQISDLKYPPDVTVDCDADVSIEKIGQPYLEFAGRKFTNLCQLGAVANDTLVQTTSCSSQILRTWFVIDWCTGEALEKIQTIDIEDQTGPMMLCNPGWINMVNATNCLGPVSFQSVFIADNCSPIQSAAAYWVTNGTLDTLIGTIVGDTIAEFGWVDEFPVGVTQVQYIVTDSCGNTGNCTYKMVVYDMTAPTAVCQNIVEVSLGNDGMLTFSADLLDNGSFDDCAPLSFRARFAQPNPCFPITTFRDSLELCCSNNGDTLDVTLRVYDIPANLNEPEGFGNGHYDECIVQLVVLDPDSICIYPVNPFHIGGKIQTENNLSNVENAKVKLEVNPSSQGAVFQTQTDDNGVFSFNAPLLTGDGYTVTPSKNTNPLNGVSTFDLVLISKHILGLEALGSPYKMIAADANKSNSITTFDIVEFRKLILGIYDTLPNNKSWRFVPKEYVFPDPANPFQPPFPESITRNNISADQLDDDFIGIKVGDVNNTVIANDFQSTDDRAHKTLFFNVKNRAVQAGEEFTVQFTAAEQVQGWQFTLNTDDLETLAILPGAGISEANFAVFEGAITTSVENEATTFSVKFQALKRGQLNEMLSISSRITRAEAYEPNGKRTGVALRFDDGAVAQPGFELFQNQPNPFSDRTSIGFYLPENADATLTIFDETGRVLFIQSGHYERGYDAISIEKTAIRTTGVLYYKLETPTHNAVRRMVLVK